MISTMHLYSKQETLVQQFLLVITISLPVILCLGLEVPQMQEVVEVCLRNRKVLLVNHIYNVEAREFDIMSLQLP